jgi:alpha-1,3-rhamnosyl/mannosyltransferase
MVHTVHSITSPRDGEFPMSLRQRAIHAYGNLLARRSRSVIGVSAYVSDYLINDLRIPKDRVRTVHLGAGDAFRAAVAHADPSAFDTPGLGDAPYIVCVGNIEPVKNHATAVKALGTIRDQVPHHLVVAGHDGKPAATELRRLIDQENLGGRIHLAGFLDLPTLASCLMRAELQVHPSLSEGFGLAVLEGMHAGVPIIGSAIPGLGEVMGDTGRTIEDPRDYRSLGKAIAEWLADPTDAKESADRARVHADRFRWRSAALQTLEVYEACLEGP